MLSTVTPGLSFEGTHKVLKGKKEIFQDPMSPQEEVDVLKKAHTILSNDLVDFRNCKTEQKGDDMTCQLKLTPFGSPLIIKSSEGNDSFVIQENNDVYIEEHAKERCANYNDGYDYSYTLEERPFEQGRKHHFELTPSEYTPEQPQAQFINALKDLMKKFR